MGKTTKTPILKYSIEGKFQREYASIMAVEDDYSDGVEYSNGGVGKCIREGTHLYKNKYWMKKPEDGIIKQEINIQDLFPQLSEEDDKIVLEDSKVEGLGDVVKSITSALGIPQCEACRKRQIQLNRLFPFSKTKKIAPLTDRELLILDTMNKTRTLQQEHKVEFFDAYNKRFIGNKANYITVCNCPGVVSKLKESLDLLRTD
jgi:hypothetical protein